MESSSHISVMKIIIIIVLFIEATATYAIYSPLEHKQTPNSNPVMSFRAEGILW